LVKIDLERFANAYLSIWYVLLFHLSLTNIFVLDEIDKKSSAETSLVGTDRRFCTMSQGWSSDVKMCPSGTFLNESEEEGCSMGGTAHSRFSHVPNVAVVTDDGFFVLRSDWKVPDGLE